MTDGAARPVHLDRRAEHIARQGSGARYDAPNAPARDLAWARAGTAYFARLLNNLRDEALDHPAARRGWPRRAIIAQTGYQARHLSHFVAAARGGDMAAVAHVPIEVNPEEIALGQTLPARALRHLVEHAAVHLNVEWRDLSQDDWNRKCPASNGQLIAVRATPLLRAQLLWQNALDLDAGARLRDLPVELRRHL